MDIRNFFAKKGGAQATKKRSAATVATTDVPTDDKKTKSAGKKSSRTKSVSAVTSSTGTNSNNNDMSLQKQKKNSNSLESSPKRTRIKDDERRRTSSRTRKIIEPKKDDSDATTDDEEFISQQHKKSNSVKVEESMEHKNEIERQTSASIVKQSMKNISPQRRRILLEESDDEEWNSNDENDILPSSKKKTLDEPSTSNSKNNKRKRTPNKSKPIVAKKIEKSTPSVKPVTSLDSYPADSATPGCLEGLCFVFSGVLPDFSREDSEDYIKTLGGRVTKAVSGKTNYLVCGETLEDGRDYKEGSKYRKATELGESKVTLIHGKGELFGLVKLLDEKKKIEINKNEPINDNSTTTSNSSKVINNPYAKKSTSPMIKNPYASSKNKQMVKNPYTKSPSKVTTTTTNGAKTSSIAGGGRADMSDPHALWTDKYAPNSTQDILGNQESVRKLSVWLNRWETTFNNPQAKKRAIGSPHGPFKAALLSGPPGIGKTTTAVLVAKQAGRSVLELNASDTRSKKSLVEGLGDVTGSHVLSFTNKKTANNENKKKRCIIMDEVDGMGAGDRSGMSELIHMIKTSKVPIICICNDRQSQKVRSLAAYCLDLKYRRPVKTVIARRAMEIGSLEGMKVEMNAAEAIAESCGNDIRQVLNCLQMWANKKKQNSGGKSDMTYKELKERQGFINKDEILRVSMFDATRLIIEGCKGVPSENPKAANDSLYKRCDAYFTDYSLMGLNVHQNYIKVMISQFQETKKQNDEEEELACLERMHAATDSMSDFGVVENAVRGGDQNWALLPLCSVMTVKTGHHISGPNGSFMPGYPEFAGWLGKNSSRGKMFRLLKELNHHMNYKVGVDSTELRLLYIPVLRDFFMKLMTGKNGPKTNEVIEMMDEYGLDRDDLFENLDVFTLESKPKKFSNLESKVKAAFTREYNKRSHKSQALVSEQGMTKNKKKKSNENGTVGRDIDIVDDDAAAQDEDDEDDSLSEDDVSKRFKKKARASKPNKKASKGKKKK